MFGEYAALFILGITTFLSPCSIALISVYLTYATGMSQSIRKGFVVGCSFALAMSLVFFFLGYAVSSLIPLNVVNYRLFFGLSGVLLIIFGISNLGLLKKIGLTKASSSFSEWVNALKLSSLTSFSRYNYLVGSFLFGVVISVALGPCSLSLVLPAILFTLFSAPTPLYGGFLLLMFGLGHAVPVIFLSTFLATARKAVSSKGAIVGLWLTKIFGTVFVAIGAIMIVDAVLFL